MVSLEDYLSKSPKLQTIFQLILLFWHIINIISQKLIIYYKIARSLDLKSYLDDCLKPMLSNFIKQKRLNMMIGNYLILEMFQHFSKSIIINHSELFLK